MHRIASDRACRRGTVPTLVVLGALLLVTPAWLETRAGSEPASPRAIDTFDDDDDADRLRPTHLLEGIELRIDSLRNELRAPRLDAPETLGDHLDDDEDPEAPLPRTFDPARAGR